MNVVAKTLLRCRPDVSRRLLAKEQAVAAERPSVPVIELVAFGGAAFRRAVMQRRAENLGAEFLPVGVCVEQMQVPCLIDLVRRRHRMPRRDGKEGETFVFTDRAFSEVDRPVVVACEASGKEKRGIGRIG